MIRDDGQDKTGTAEDKRLAQKALDEQNRMPFFQSAPPVRYFPKD